jgi:hypothetical protein
MYFSPSSCAVQSTPSPSSAVFYFQQEVLHFSLSFIEFIYLIGSLAGFGGGVAVARRAGVHMPEPSKMHDQFPLLLQSHFTCSQHQHQLITSDVLSIFLVAIHVPRL